MGRGDERSAARGRSSWWKRLAVALATLALLLGGAEAFFRLRPAPAEEEHARSSFVVPDAALRWRLAPIERGPFATNELGWRDGPWDPDADRVLLWLGDSVSWGDGVADRTACFASLVEEGLRRADPTRSLELVNAAVPGWATFQERDWLRGEGLALEPDAVVLQACLNDVTERYRVLAEYGGGDRFLGIDTRAVVPGLHGFLLAHSAAYRVLGRELMRRARDREAYSVKKLCEGAWGSELDEAWALFEGELREVVETARGAGVPIGVVLTPYRFQLDDPTGSRRPQDELGAWLAELDVPFLDLLPPLAGAGGELFNDPSHLSVRGHLIASRAILAWLPTWCPIAVEVPR